MLTRKRIQTNKNGMGYQHGDKLRGSLHEVASKKGCFSFMIDELFMLFTICIEI